MSQKLVTLNQVKSVQQMANAKKLGRPRFQGALDDGTVSRFLDRLKDNPILVFPPQGARIHIVEVEIIPDCPWELAVVSACPKTESFEEISNVEVSKQYKPLRGARRKECLVLVNFLDDSLRWGAAPGWDEAHSWAVAEDLKKTSPYELFALCAQNSNLHHALLVSSVIVVATMTCNYDHRTGDDSIKNACCVTDEGRGMIIKTQELRGGSFWFVFRK